MRSNEELMKGILERKAAYRAKKQLRRLETAGAGLGAALAAALIFAPGIRDDAIRTPAANSTLGATILGPEAGGYVIVGLLAFALGVVLTMIILKRREADTSGITAEKADGKDCRCRK